MKRIEVISPQNVPLEYRLASFQTRMFAFLIDVLIMAALVYAIYLTASVFSMQNRDKKIMQFVIISPLLLFYSLVSEIITQGYSPGKKLMKIRIIKITGEPLQISDFLIRWMFRWIDIWGSLGSVAAFQISSSERGQRIGDLLADTTVISESSNLIVSLKELRELNKNSDAPIVYPGVIQLSEQEMLWIRYALLRYKRIPNEAHQKLIRDLALNLSEKLQINSPPAKPAAFLEQLIRDFVRVTRS